MRNPSNKTKISGNISIPPGWWKEHYGFEWKNPVTTDIHALIEDDLWVEKTLHSHFPDLSLGSDDPQPCYALRTYSLEHLIAMAYGAPAPKFDASSESFWHDRTIHVWEWIETINDVKRIKIHDWATAPGFREVVERYYNYQEIFIGREIPIYELFWPWTNPLSGVSYELTQIPSFIDIGALMFGLERFFEILATDERLAEALMEKYSEIADSIMKFFMKLAGKTEIKGLLSFGGNYSFFLSADMYRKYGLGFDFMTSNRYGKDLPSNLHSCGASAHLYDVWSEYPNPIILMQTRGIPGEIQRLRRNLPQTLLEITIAAPQYDPFGDLSIRDAVHNYIEEVGGRDASISVILPYMSATHDDNVREFYAALDEWNSSINN